MTKQVGDCLSHDMLVKRARRWLWGKGCAVVITEMTTGVSESPDAIGFHPGYSIVIECKTNRADFLRDKQKPHNRRLNENMGDKRYYLAPKGIVKPDELPEKHGLLEPHGKGVKIVESAEFRHEKDCRGELTLLISAIRRVAGKDFSATSVRFYTYETKNRATMGVKPDTPVAKEER